MAATGMPMDALLTTTCLVSAFGTLLMGVLANYPVGLAPGMGSNFFFVFSIIPACAAALGVAVGHPAGWQAALGVILVSGVIFLVISLTRFRSALIYTVSDSQKSAIAAGLGLFIGMLGLRSGHIIQIKGEQLALGESFSDPAVIVFAVGLRFRRCSGAGLERCAPAGSAAVPYRRPARTGLNIKDSSGCRPIRCRSCSGLILVRCLNMR